VFRPFGAVAEWWWDAGSLLAASLLVLPVALPGRRADVGRRLLASPPMVLLGVVSYGVYLWNLIAYRYLSWHRSAWWSPNGLWAFIALAVTLTIVVAYCSYVLLERPVLEAVHRAVGTTRRGDGSGRRPRWRIPVGAERLAVVDWVDTEPPLSPAFIAVVWVVAAGALGALAWTLPTLRAAIG
jgi:peptidoglycan/LPS O-acetylase OafA/YrhL